MVFSSSECTVSVSDGIWVQGLRKPTGYEAGSWANVRTNGLPVSKRNTCGETPSNTSVNLKPPLPTAPVVLVQVRVSG